MSPDEPPRRSTERRASDGDGANNESYGRRRSDHDPRTTISRKLLVIVVFLGEAIYLVGSIFLNHPYGCL